MIWVLAKYCMIKGNASAGDLVADGISQNLNGWVSVSNAVDYIQYEVFG